MATSVYPLSVLPCAVKERERPRVEVNSSDVLEIVGPERTVQELAAVSDENSRRKLQNVVANSSVVVRDEQCLSTANSFPFR